MDKILLVDDEEQLLKIVGSSLTTQGYDVYTANNGQAARQLVEKADIVFLDINMPDISGLMLLEELKGLYPNKMFIMMTAYDDVASAVASIKAGAFNYLVKPAKLSDIIHNIEKSKEYINLIKEKNNFNNNMDITEEELGHCLIPSLKNILPFIKKTASTDVSILIEGETGTGKSMLANIIHKLSARKAYPFVQINCAAIPEQLLESELFGYEKGAFTGAASTTIGKFEAAHNGTIFLDEIGEIPLSLQAKLLQVTQDKSFMRLGSTVKRKADVRIISASNKKLKELVKNGKFRDDLYYRLNIVNMELIPLRHRKNDITFLIEILLDKYRKKYNKEYKISKYLLDKLTNLPWYGNIRELENAIERAVILCNGEELSINDFIVDNMSQSYESTGAKSLNDQLYEIEKNIIQENLAESNGNIAEAARRLGVSRQNLLYKINKYNIEN